MSIEAEMTIDERRKYLRKTSYSLSSPQNRYEGQIKRPVAAR